MNEDLCGGVWSTPYHQHSKRFISLELANEFEAQLKAASSLLRAGIIPELSKEEVIEGKEIEFDTRAN